MSDKEKFVYYIYTVGRGGINILKMFKNSKNHAGFESKVVADQVCKTLNDKRGFWEKFSGVVYYVGTMEVR